MLPKDPARLLAYRRKQSKVKLKLWREGVYANRAPTAHIWSRRQRLEQSKRMRAQWRLGRMGTYVDYARSAHQRWADGVYDENTRHKMRMNGLQLWRTGKGVRPFNATYGTPTRYRGVCFRSQLEAAWAQSLQLSGIRWRYESQRVALPNGQTYTPDFFLPDYGFFLEVKPDGPWTNEREQLRKLRLASLQIPLLIACGLGSLEVA